MARIFRAARNALIPLFLLLASGTSAFAQHTYYISKSTGSDGNSSLQAKLKATPWAHIPGMASCASNCASYTPVAGDTFILKGCDSWLNADMPILWNWSGSAGNVITIGVDKTWYNTGVCPSAWNRPIWDAQKTTITGWNDVFTAAYGGNTSYVTMDNIEMKGLHCPSGGCVVNHGDYILGWGTMSYWIFSNLYLHGWDVVTDVNCELVQQLGPTNTFTTSVIDGSDRTSADTWTNGGTGTCYAFYVAVGNITNNVIHDLPNGIVGSAYSGTSVISGNLMYNALDSNSGGHANFIETLGPGTYYIHDNVIHDGADCQMLLVGNTGETDYIWNNLFYNQGTCSLPASPQNFGFTGMSMYIWNNTIVGSGTQKCVTWGSGHGGSYVTVTIQNNHCISTGGVADTTWPGSPTQTINYNVLQTPTAATGQGFTSSETYVYSPTASGNATVGAGTNLSSNCSGALAGLCSDANYAVIYNPTAQTVTVPHRTSVARPATPDVGAYQFSGSQAQAPQPPTNLQASVQ